MIFLRTPTFARVTFNTATYAPFRPTYPRQLFDYVFKYHESSRKLWDDLRKGMLREEEDGKEEVRIESPLAISLAKGA